MTNINEITKFVANFLSTEHDYEPIWDGSNQDIIGCFNTKYHGDMCQAVVHPPLDSDRESLPVKIIAYELMRDGSILLCDDSLNAIKLEECLGNSVDAVYAAIETLYRVRDEYERNKKTGGF